MRTARKKENITKTTLKNLIFKKTKQRKYSIRIYTCEIITFANKKALVTAVVN